MSSTRYKIKYKDNLGSYGASRERYLYVHEHDTADVTTVYNDEGEVVYSWHTDNQEEASLLARIIRGECSDDERETWRGDFPEPRIRTRGSEFQSPKCERCGSVERLLFQGFCIVCLTEAAQVLRTPRATMMPKP